MRHESLHFAPTPESFDPLAELGQVSQVGAHGCSTASSGLTESFDQHTGDTALPSSYVPS